MIDIKNVSKWYGSFQVLTDCSTAIQKGEVVVVCGPSGSGKSTLIKTVNALEPFQKGDIVVDGVSIADSKTNLPKLRARGHGVPAFRAVSSSERHREPDAGPDQGAAPRRRGCQGARAENARPGRADGPEGQVSRSALRRPAAARGHRQGAEHGSDR